MHRLLTVVLSTCAALRLRRSRSDPGLALHISYVNAPDDANFNEAVKVTLKTGGKIVAETAERKCNDTPNPEKKTLCNVGATLIVPSLPIQVHVYGKKEFYRSDAPEEKFCITQSEPKVVMKHGRCAEPGEVALSRAAVDLSSLSSTTGLEEHKWEVVAGNGLRLGGVLIKKPATSESKVLIVRHAESVWNQGQSNSEFGKMFGDSDHPLSQTGVKQAKQLREDIAAAQAAGKVLHGFTPTLTLLSPFTRASETAILGLPSSFRSNSVFSSAIREKKNFAGQDTVGQFVGLPQLARIFGALGSADYTRETLDERVITTHASSATDRLLMPQRASTAANYAIGDAMQQWWWGGTMRVETPESIHDRLGEAESLLRVSQHESMAWVGHSHNWRELFQEMKLAPSVDPMTCGLKFVYSIDKLANAAAVLVTLENGSTIKKLEVFQSTAIDKESSGKFDCKALLKACPGVDTTALFALYVKGKERTC